MAIYHLSAKIISRSSGRSAVGASAYRAGEKLINEHDGMTHDYTKKSGIVHSEIILCENAPAEYKDRQTLWNAVEKIEKSNNAQLSREIEIALPVELERDEQKKLVHEYVKDNFVKAGMCADISIHDKADGNPHAHIMLTMRSIDDTGKWESKSKKVYQLDESGEKIYNKKTRQYKCTKGNTTDWNEQSKMEEWRESWAQKLNHELEKKNIPDRVDHRSFERQGIEKVATVHMGTTANQLEKMGKQTDRGNYNRAVKEYNQELEKINFALVNLETEKQAIKAQTSEPVKQETPAQIAERLYNQEKEVLKFIADMKGVEKYFEELQQEQRQIPLLCDRLNEDSENIKAMYHQSKGIESEIAELKNSSSLLKNNSKEIKAKTKQLDNLKNSFSQAVKTFRNDWKIEPQKDQISAKIQEYENRLEHLKQETPGEKIIQDKKRSAKLDYKTNKLLAELRPDQQEIKSELVKLKQADQSRVYEKTGSKSISLYISDKDRKEIAEKIKEKDPAAAKKIMEQVRGTKSKNQEQIR